MVFIFLGLSSIAGTVFSVAFVTWIVALIINKKDLIKRAWKFTWISFIVAVSIGVVSALGIYSGSNHSSDSDIEQVDDAESTSEDEEFSREEEARQNAKEDMVYTKKAPKHDPIDGSGVLSKYNMKNGYKVNYYKDDGSYYYYREDSSGNTAYNLNDEITTVKGNEAYLKKHKDDISEDYLQAYGNEVDMNKYIKKDNEDNNVFFERIKATGVFTVNPPKRDNIVGGVLSKKYNRKNGYLVNYYYGTAKTPLDYKETSDTEYYYYINSNEYPYTEAQGYEYSTPTEEGKRAETVEDNEEHLRNAPQIVLQQ